MAVEVGAEFKTYEDLTNAIRAYEAENFVNLIIRDTRKVEAAAKRNQRKNYNPDIKYSDISYCCTYGGKKYVSHSTGKRNHKTIKQACPFSLKVRATVDGQRLFVREMCNTHNHELSEAEFRLHPKQRKLDMGSQEEIANLLCMEPDKKLLRDKLMQITGKVILMKDIHNIKTRLVNPKIRCKEPKTELSNSAEDKMENIHCAEVGSETETQLMVENQIQEQVQPSEEIQIPISHVAQAHIDSSHTSIMIHQPNQQLDGTVQHCYISNNQNYQQQPQNVYTVNVQSFQPTPVYNMSSQPFQQASPNMLAGNIMHTVQHMDADVGNSQQFQHWTTLEEIGRQNIQDSGYQTITTLSFPDQQNQAQQMNPQQPQPHIQQQQPQQPPLPPQQQTTVQISNPQSLQPVIIENSNIPVSVQQPPTLATTTQDLPSSLQGRRGRKRQSGADSSMTIRERKRRKSAVQADKDTLMKKYFQQATVNLFFNERLKSPGNKFLKPLKPGLKTAAAKMSEPKADNKFHDMLRPLAWLFGKWRSESGKGIYPTINDFTYAEEAEFQPIGQKPMVEYKFYSWKPENNMPMHRETGFIRIKPESNHIAFMSAHNLGVVEIQEGEFKDQELTVQTKSIGRASFNKPPEVKTIKRTLKRSENELEQVMDMADSGGQVCPVTISDQIWVNLKMFVHSHIWYHFKVYSKHFQNL